MPQQHTGRVVMGSSPLLWAGVAAAPIFCGTVLFQALLRPGFDFIAMPLSLLSLGEWGWIQTLTFLVAGALIIGGGVGAWKARKATAWVAVPIMIYGLGMLCAGVFQSDPIEGFPPEAHPAAVMSRHAMLHGLSFMVAQLALSLACIVVAVNAAGRARGLAIYSLLTGLATPALVVFGFVHPHQMGLAFYATGLAALSWLAVFCFPLADRAGT